MSASHSVLPEPTEAVGGELSVAHCVLDVAVPEVVLNCARVSPVVGEFEASRVPEHVRMDRKLETGFFTCGHHDLPKRGVGDGPFTLGVENEPALRSPFELS